MSVEKPGARLAGRLDLDQSSCRQIFHKGRIGFEKIETGQSVGGGPLQISENSIFQFAVVFPHDKKTQFDCSSIWIRMLDARDLIPDFGVNA